MVSASALAVSTAIYTGYFLQVQSVPWFSDHHHQDHPNVVDLGYVRYRGNLSYANTVAYLGLPYAEPPLGERRYRAPLPLSKRRIAREAGTNVVNAVEYPQFCVQETTGGEFFINVPIA
jgi:hypothetical protein